MQRVLPGVSDDHFRFFVANPLPFEIASAGVNSLSKCAHFGFGLIVHMIKKPSTFRL